MPLLFVANKSQILVYSKSKEEKIDHKCYLNKLIESFLGENLEKKLHNNSFKPIGFQRVFCTWVSYTQYIIRE